MFYSLSVDVLSNFIRECLDAQPPIFRQLILEVMAFALYLAWNLQFTLKSLAQQTGFCAIIIGTLFCTSAAFFRAIVSRDTDHPSGLPTASWLALWTIIEAALAVIIACLPGLDIADIHQRPVPRAMTPLDYHHHARFDSRGFAKHSATYSLASPVDDISLSPISSTHHRIASFTEVAVTRPALHNRSRSLSTSSTNNRPKHVPIKLPSTYGPSHKRSATGSASLASVMLQDTTPTSHTGDIVPVSTPGVSRRASKASLRYTPIQIPGSMGHKRDQSGSLSGAFWGDMDESERARLEERAKQIKIQVTDTRVISTSYGDRDGYGSGLGYAV